MQNKTPDIDTVGDESDAGEDLGRLLDWYAVHARTLPWREPDCSPWGVLVSEVMLQQTPVARVEPRWRAWMSRWPTPAELAAESTAEVIRAWDRLGYPRRALRLQAAAQQIRDRHGGVVPADLADLRALPGVGEYTAAAVAVFAFRQRHPVLDTNVRRVWGRWRNGRQYPLGNAISASERALAADLLPADPELAPVAAVAWMELGALVCTARDPKCEVCPLRLSCRWQALGAPSGLAPKAQPTYVGSDRQARGFVLARLRVSECAIDTLADEWHGPPSQAYRAIDSLEVDGLIVRENDRVRLPD